MSISAKASEAVAKSPAREPASRHGAACVPSALAASSAIGNLPMQRAFLRTGIQAKLTTSQPGDPDEQEADRVAERVMTSPTPGHGQTNCPACAASSTTCPKCEEEKKVQRKALPGAPQARGPHLPALRGGGHPLSGPTRAFFEPHFGTNLGSVRIHTDDAASHAARSISARAFTLGHDIAFARDQFAPETPDGKRLLAHELTHVIQQAQGGSFAHIARDKDPKAAPAPVSPVPLDFFGAPEKCYVPKGPTTTFEGILLASNADYLDEVLCDYIAKHGESDASEFVERFRNKVAGEVENLPGGGAGEDPAERTVEKYGSQELQNASHISKTLDQALTKRLANNKQWLAHFEAKANEVVLGMLQESEDRVNEERIRYGISWEEIEYTGYRMRRDSMVATKEHYTQYSMKDTPESRALAEAATGLLTRKHAFDKAHDDVQEYGKSMGGGMGEFARQRGWAGTSSADSDMIHLNDLRGIRSQAKRDLDVFRTQKTAEFPILAAYASEDDISEDSLERLQQLASGKSPAATNMMGKEIKTRLEHIADVRKDINEDNGKETKIWRVPRIINGTREMTGATPGTMYGRLVDDKVKDEAPGIWTSILIGLLQLVLVLLAPFTAGLTLIPAAAISVGQAYVHFREYERAQMLRGTDFGALALSSEDPSLFWLAVDIIGAGFDVGAAAGAAMNVFRALAPAARAARAAKTAEAVEEAARNLERTATELGGEALAKTVGRDARVGSEAVGETAEEAKALEHAGERMAKQELEEAEVLPGFKVKAEPGSADIIPGRSVKVSESGNLWSCASPCTLLRERYKDVLQRASDLEKKGLNVTTGLKNEGASVKWEERLTRLEKEAAELPKGKAGAVRRKQLADEAASLEKEMRTTSLVGDWKSPLKLENSEKFKQAVERRGSIAEKLDHHPPGWSGKDEARFRYGEEIETEEGYRWLLDEDGKLRYERTDASKPVHRYNDKTGKFEDVVGESQLIKAKKGPEEARKLATIPKEEKKAMEAAFEQRSKAIAERDRLEKLEEAGTVLDPKDKANVTEKLKATYAEINEQSRQLGENAAEGVMKRRGGKKIYPEGESVSKSGDFDQVWKVGGEFQIVEAKGGSSGLGSRSVGEGVRAEQGTVEYAKSIAQNMAKHGATDDIKALGEELLVAIAKGKVKYVLVRAPISTERGASVIREIKVSEFVLK